MNIDEYYNTTYRLAYLIRYSNVPRIKDESVAEHSFFVSALVMHLSSKYSFDLGKALAIAICHDMPESVTNDISHETKKLFPEINSVLKKAEKEFASTLPSKIRESILSYDEDSVEAKIVHLADAMQCYQYASNERDLGNNGYMLTVIESSTKRITKLTKELKKYENT